VLCSVRHAGRRWGLKVSAACPGDVQRSSRCNQGNEAVSLRHTMSIRSFSAAFTDKELKEVDEDVNFDWFRDLDSGTHQNISFPLS
jgi:hypothetical protein